MAQYNQQRAFVLHRWPYRETSLLLDLLTEHNGRIRLLAKGARRRHSTRFSCLQPFIPLQVNWYGQNELKILQQAEPMSLALPLMGPALYSALYVNELLYRLLVPEIPYDALFNDYLHCLCQLAIGPQACEPGLRCFELALLQALGYGINFSHCADNGEPVIESALYRYMPEHGFIKDPIVGPLSFSGYQLRALAERRFPTTETLRAAKSFTRLAIKPYLGNKPLKSRELFGQSYQKSVHR